MKLSLAFGVISHRLGLPKPLSHIGTSQVCCHDIATLRIRAAWKENYSWQSEEVAKAVASRIEILLLAAVVGSKKRMWQVLGEIIETLDRCRTDFNLERPIDQILAKQRPTDKMERDETAAGMGSLVYCDAKATTFFAAASEGMISQ